MKTEIAVGSGWWQNIFRAIRRRKRLVPVVVRVGGGSSDLFGYTPAGAAVTDEAITLEKAHAVHFSCPRRLSSLAAGIITRETYEDQLWVSPGEIPWIQVKGITLLARVSDAGLAAIESLIEAAGSSHAS